VKNSLEFWTLDYLDISCLCSIRTAYIAVA